MPFLRPGLGSLRDQAVSDLAGSPLRWVITQAIAWAVAQLAHGHYGYLDWIARQSVPFTATDEHLEAWAGLVGILRKPATAATGSGTWSGVPGTVLPAGTPAVRGDGMRYFVAADVTVPSGGTVTGALVAELPGADGNTGGVVRLTLGGAIAGINSAGSGVVGSGADQETDDGLRSRMLQRYAAPPQGGSATDYLEWALTVPGVTRAWAKPLGAGGGTVVVYTMWDYANASTGGFPGGVDGVASAETRDTPATGDKLVVANAIYPLRPATALVFSVAPLPSAISFVLHGRTTIPTTVRPLIEAAIDAVFVALASPLAQELETSPFEVAIAAVPGMPPFTMTSPASPITAPLGYLPVRAVPVTYG